MAALTTIATAASLAATAGGTGASFAQARKQRMLQQDAQRKAQDAMAAAKKRLEVNVYEQQAVAKEPYELQREALLRSGAQAMEAARESERGVAAAAGRIQTAQATNQAGVRAGMAADIQGMRNRIIDEEARLLDEGMIMNQEIVSGAQQAAAAADEARRAAIMQGVQGLGNAANQLYENAPLYMKDAVGRNLARANKATGGVTGLKERLMADPKALGQLGLERNLLAAMTPQQLQSYITENATPDVARAFRETVSSPLSQVPAYAFPAYVSGVSSPGPYSNMTQVTGLTPNPRYDMFNPFATSSYNSNRNLWQGLTE